MLRRWAGPLVTALIVGGVVLILVLNLNPGGMSASPKPPEPKAPEVAAQPAGTAKPAGFKEYPIADPVVQNHMKIAAVWLPPIQMDGMVDPAASDLIHLEADIHATEGNPNGFSKGEFVPYLKIRYSIAPADGGAVIQQGELRPMVAGDGLHYGASVAMPQKGRYRLTYDIEPPSVGGLGRHVDPVTGVAPWWKPFQVQFDWDYEPPPKAPAPPGA